VGASKGGAGVLMPWQPEPARRAQGRGARLAGTGQVGDSTSFGALGFSSRFRLGDASALGARLDVGGGSMSGLAVAAMFAFGTDEDAGVQAFGLVHSDIPRSRGAADREGVANGAGIGSPRTLEVPRAGAVR